MNRAEEPKTESDRTAIRSRIREILHQAYRMGFDYHKETCNLFVSEEKPVLALGLVSFALLWMEFVRTRCERGRGLRPRWANQGLEFLILVCEPHYTKHLTDDEFEELKTSMDRCISHVIGTATVSTSTEVDSKYIFSFLFVPSILTLFDINFQRTYELLFIYLFFFSSFEKITPIESIIPVAFA